MEFGDKTHTRNEEEMEEEEWEVDEASKIESLFLSFIFSAIVELFLGKLLYVVRKWRQIWTN